MSFRSVIERKLGVTLTKLGLPVVLIDPDGVIHDTDQVTGNALQGQVLNDTTRMSPETGEDISTPDPIVSIRRQSLARIPQDGERWGVRIPLSPVEGAALEDFLCDYDRAREGGGSIGFIRLYLHRPDQT